MSKKKSINSRCPLNDTCERKSCEYEMHELDCDFYRNNSFGEYVIPDQEEIRQSREAEFFDEYDEKLIEYLPIELLHPHPDNPREDLGDLTELADSIKEKGILQNLTVIPAKEGYTIIIGHRRCAAAKLAGLTKVPCYVAPIMSHAEQVQLMLLENMQRNELTIYEQAQGFQMLLDLGSTMDDVAEKTGFSKTTVRRRVSLMELDQTKLKAASERQISLGDLDKLNQLTDVKARNELLDYIGTNNYDYNLRKALDDQKRKERVDYLTKEVTARGMTKIDSKVKDFYQSYRYVTGVSTESDIEKLDEKIQADTQYYYSFSGGCCYIYTEITQKDDKVNPEEARKEAAKKESIRLLGEAAARMYELRINFLKGLKNSKVKGYVPIASKSLVSHMVRRAYYSTPNWDTLMRLVGAEGSDDKNLIIEFAELNPELGLIFLLYSFYGDNAQKSYHSSWNGQYCKNEQLDNCYALLEGLGYYLSDDEEALRDGTSDLFIKPEPDDYEDEEEYDEDEDEETED